MLELSLFLQSWFTFRNLNILYKSMLSMLCSNMRVTLLQVVTPNDCNGYLQQKKVICPSVDPLLAEGSWWDDYRVITNHLADYFSTVFVTKDLSHPQPHQVSATQLMFSDSTVPEIVKALHSLKLLPESGCGGLPNVLFRKCAVTLSYPLYLIFTKSVSCVEVTSLENG